MAKISAEELELKKARLSVDDEGKTHFLDGKSMTPKQIRARARRAGKIHAEELQILYKDSRKPIEDWDAEELARGYPKLPSGRWPNHRPNWISQEGHERIVERFQQVVRDGMREATVPALSVMQAMLTNNRKDRRGRPEVPWSVKADLIKFLIEHVIGKPKQRIEGDISVRLQAMMAHAMVIPGEEQPVGIEPQSMMERALLASMAEPEEESDEDYQDEE